jgi:hypothetical protein
MPSRWHGITLGWLLTVKASQFSEKFNPISLGFADHTNFAPATSYSLRGYWMSTSDKARYVNKRALTLWLLRCGGEEQELIV